MLPHTERKLRELSIPTELVIVIALVRGAPESVQHHGQAVRCMLAGIIGGEHDN